MECIEGCMINCIESRVIPAHTDRVEFVFLNMNHSLWGGGLAYMGWSLFHGRYVCISRTRTMSRAPKRAFFQILVITTTSYFQTSQTAAQ